ncbi:HNH endonuclease [Mesorhizobium sp. M4B.F.Ca.ET.089.01.1.1]|nr:HNH endonuclease [Mesorhizobium sp. M4B.F.Ca.ET.089.01.1.1]
MDVDLESASTVDTAEWHSYGCCLVRGLSLPKEGQPLTVAAHPLHVDEARMCKMCKSKKLARIRTRLACNQDGRCFYCEFPMWDRDPTGFSERYNIPVGSLDRFRCTVEHLNPRMNGGKDNLDNLVAACRFCNQNRHKMKEVPSPFAFRQHVQKRVKAGRWHPP